MMKTDKNTQKESISTSQKESISTSQKVSKLAITLVRSIIGATKKQKATLKGLGLRAKIGKSRVLIDTLSLRGMIKKLSHLLLVKPA